MPKEDYMEVSKVSNLNDIATVSKKSDILDKDAFLKILTVQLRNQDPLNAKDNTEYIAQMAQFAALEQMQNLNANIQKLLISQRFTEGTMLIGKEVEIKVNEKVIKEIVNGVKVEANEVYIKTEGGMYKLDQVIGVGDVKIDKQD
jgi:flagellar basal-body rod modification protein FlgD